MSSKGILDNSPSLDGGNVWVVTGGWDYEGEMVVAILATKEKADAAAELARAHKYSRFDTVDVTEWTIGDLSELK